MRSRFLVLTKIVLVIGLLFADEYYRDFITVQPFRKYAPVAINFGLAMLIIDVLRSLIAAGYRRRKHMRWSQTDNFLIGVEQITAMLFTVVISMTVLRLFNVPVRQFFTSISIFAAALALLLKDYIANVVSGMIITFSNRLSVGDHIRIQNHEGRIVDITLTNIHLLNDDEDLVLIPTMTAFSADILNYTKGDIRKTSLEFEVELRHLPPTHELERRLIAEVISIGQALIQPDTCRLKVMELKHEYVMLKFQYSLVHPDRDEERRIRREMNRRIADMLHHYYSV